MNTRSHDGQNWTRLILAALICSAALMSACGSSDGDASNRTLDPVDVDGDQQVDSGGEAPDSTVDPSVDEPAAGESTPPTTIDLPTPSGSELNTGGTFLDLDSFPYDQIFSGGPPKDGIPALTNPPVVGPASVSYVSDDDLVLGVVINGESRAYPHNIGWWHEIVNDRVGGMPISVTFCPLTGTGLVFDAADEDGRQFELGVSGLLFNNNLIMYDRRDRTTLYPQIAHKGIEGPRRGETLALLPVVETTWRTWKELHPDTKIVAGGTYPIDQYARYPYGDYRTNNDYFLFRLTTPIAGNTNPFAVQLQTKERVLGVRLDGEPKAYPFSAMGERAVINDRVGGVDILVAWDRDYYLAIPYARRVGEQTLSFDIEPDSGAPFDLRDRETNTLWNIHGEAIEGPLAGRKLVQVPAHNSMWFAWVTFWQNTGVWQ